MKISVKNFDNQQVREIELPEEIFGYPYKQHLIHEAVVAYLSGLRSGTHKTKTRSEVSGFSYFSGTCRLGGTGFAGM